jgi:6-phosphogluconolactonase
MPGRIDVQADAAAVARHVAAWLTQRAINTPGRFAVSLSGGSTPKTLYGLLAAEPFRDRFPWHRTHLFFGDERFVPPDHPDSNYRMAREALIAHVPVPATHVHAWNTSGDPQQSAVRYADTLKRFYGTDTLDASRALFDVTFLGLGDDGHTASLFPGVAALRERTAWTAAVIGAKPEPRLTLTYPALGSSNVVAFIVNGIAKKAILARAYAGDPTLPAAGVQPLADLIWFTDEATAPSSVSP